MKNIIVKFSFLSVAVLVLGLTSCNQDNLREETVEEARKPAYSFYQPALSAELTPDYNGQLNVAVTRTSTTEAATVEVSFTADSATATLFTLNSTTVSFAAGAATANAVVSFDLNSLSTTGTQYAFSIGFTNTDTPLSLGASNVTAVKVSRKLTYVQVETPGTYSSAAFGNFEFVLYRAVEAPNLYKMSEFFVNTIDFSIDPVAGTATIPAQDLGEDIFGVGSNTWIRCTAGTYADGVCTFGGGTWDNAFFTDGTFARGMRMDSEVFILPEGSY